MICTIVGAGPGLGASLAERFATGGYDIAMISRSPQRLARWREEVPDPDRIRLFRADAADTAQLHTTFDEITQWGGGTDVLIYNAANMTPGPVDGLTTEVLAERMRTDVGGALTSAHRVLPAMRARGRGTILFTGGGLALEPYPEWAALAAGKAALRSIALSLHKQFLSDGVHVAVVAVCGIIEPGGPFAPETVAEQYWQLHRQPLDVADRELVYLPPGADPYYNDPHRTHRQTSLPIRSPEPLRHPSVRPHPLISE